MIVIQYITLGRRFLSTMTLAKRPQRFFPKLQGSPAKLEGPRFLRNSFGRALSPVDIGNCTDYRPFFSIGPPCSCLGELLTQLGKLEIPITES
jgi:hypothetical protein